MKIINTQIENIYINHSLTGPQKEKNIKIRGKAKELAYLILEECPCSKEQSVALERLEDSVFWAMASVARN